MRLGVFVELVAIIAVMGGVPVPISGTVALLAATPVSAIVIYRLLKLDRSGGSLVDVVFHFFTWAMLPCLLAMYATDGVGEANFRFIVATRLAAAADTWRLLRRWNKAEAAQEIAHSESAPGTMTNDYAAGRADLEEETNMADR